MTRDPFEWLLLIQVVLLVALIVLWFVHLAYMLFG